MERVEKLILLIQMTTITLVRIIHTVVNSTLMAVTIITRTAAMITIHMAVMITIHMAVMTIIHMAAMITITVVNILTTMITVRTLLRTRTLPMNTEIITTVVNTILMVLEEINIRITRIPTKQKI